MSSRNLTKVPKLTLVYFAVDKSTSVVETKKLRLKNSEQSFLKTKPERNTVVAVKYEGKQLDAMVIATHDDPDELDTEEKAFVDDPANAHLFCEPPSAKKNQPPVTGKAKRQKTSNDEVEELAKFLTEQNEKEARLKQQRLNKPRKSTKEAATQCCGRPGTVEVAVQTDRTDDVTEDLKEQVSKLTQIVADLTSLLSAAKEKDIV